MRLREEAAEGHLPTPPCCRFSGKRERLEAGEDIGTDLASICCTLFVSYCNYQSKIQIKCTLVGFTLFRASIEKQQHIALNSNSKAHWYMHNIAKTTTIIIMFQLNFYGCLHVSVLNCI